ncbi:MAG TPA: EAL domain-containing protein [Terriglobales bacterium]|nr:EAL domain-containing protein [Terriglobales bacterium]
MRAAQSSYGRHKLELIAVACTLTTAMLLLLFPAFHSTSQWTLRHPAILTLSVTILVAFGRVILLQRRILLQTSALRQAGQKAKAIQDLSAAMRQVTLKKDFSGRVKVPESDEIAPLAIAFNNMLTELELRDVAKQKAEDKLHLQALTDELTGLPNRRLLSDRSAQALAIARREQNIVAVLYVDLDGFKLVNDSLGHVVGDTLLSLVAERLQERIRHSDTLARLGGDEFAIVLTKLMSRDDAGRVAKSLLDVLAKPFFIESHEITISASIGISIFPEHSTEASDLLQQADSAMYTAKRNGKNQMVYYTAELGSVVRERVSLENQLRGAIARGEISVHYQPEFNIVTGQLVRFEALARWTHPTLGSISPCKFIPVAEESGLIIPLGAHIMERACAEAARWQRFSPDPIQVAVNVSSLQFTRETFVEEVQGVLNSTGLAACLLQIELTESVMLTGPERAAETMKTLRSLGISVAIDDFGTGYSCFSYLPRLPFNALKIDRSFVKELESRVETKALVQSLIALAKNLSMQVIVEGIETQEQLALIRKLGGNEVQGYLLGKPTPEPTTHLCKPNPVLNRNEAELVSHQEHRTIVHI